MGFTHLKKIAILLLALMMLGSIMVSCGDNVKSNQKAKENTTTESEEEKIKEVVARAALYEYYNYGKKSSYAKITTVVKVSDTYYKVSGRMTIIDKYDHYYTNDFDCSVNKNTYSDEWEIKGGFKYNDKWYW